MLETKDESVRIAAKMDLQVRISELMPQGRAQYILARPFPMISALIVEHGLQTMQSVIFALIKDFCSSLNIGKDGNMNEDQMIECAGFLLDECGNFRLEDYLMMFAMAKRGDLVKVYNRMDIQVIAQMLDEYWQRRNSAGNKAQNAPVIDSKPNVIPLADASPEVQQEFKEAKENLLKEIEAKKNGINDQAAEDARRQQMNINRRALWDGTYDKIVKPEIPEP